MNDLKLKCEECNGDGVVFYNDCNKPASMCCGGCEVSRVCVECNGSGFLEIDFFDKIYDITFNAKKDDKTKIEEIKYLINNLV